MKANKLMKMVLAMILMVGFFGCGKSSEGGDPQNNQIRNTSNFNGYGNFSNGQSVFECTNKNISSFEQFRALVATGNFPIEPHEFTYYLVQEYEVEVSTHELFGVDWLKYYTVDVDYITEIQRYSRINSDVANHEIFGNSKSSILAGLTNIVNGATAYHAFPGSSLVQVRAPNGDVYGIDLCQPLAANPIQVYKKETGEFKVAVMYNNWPFL